MQVVPLQAIPNQEFQLLVDSNSWDLTVKTTGGITSVSFLLNGVDIYDSARAVAGAFIIPSQYQENGNFIFVTQEEQLPNYEQFGVTQNLIYFSPADLALLQVPVATPITAATFNPIAGLPLRFSPVGYVEA